MVTTSLFTNGASAVGAASLSKVRSADRHGLLAVYCTLQWPSCWVDFVADCFDLGWRTAAVTAETGFGHPPDIFPQTFPSRSLSPPCHFPLPVCMVQDISPFHHHYPPIYNVKRGSVREGQEYRLLPVFKKIPHLVGRLGSGSRVVGRLGSKVRVSASSFQKVPRLVGRLGSVVWISASFQIFTWSARGDALGGEELSGRRICLRGK